MLRKLYEKSFCPVVQCPSSAHMLVTTELVSENGVMVRKSMVRKFDVNEEFKAFSFRDFDIANLLAVGAYRETPIVMSQNGDFNAIDSVANLPVKPLNNQTNEATKH